MAYIYDNPQYHESDIDLFIEQAKQLEYSLRYWWLSEAINAPNFEVVPDRLILCVNTRSQGQEAGLDLYEALEEADIFWNEHEAASFNEYAKLGKSLSELIDIKTPSGEYFFAPSPIPLLELELEDLQEASQTSLGRPLQKREITAVVATLKQHIAAQIDWESMLRDSLLGLSELDLNRVNKGKK